MSDYTQTTTTKTVITNQPVSVNTFVVKQERDWSTGLFDCFEDIGSCLCAFCCGLCLACQLAEDSEEFFCLPLCVPGALIALRTQLRIQHGIKGSICDDCIMASFCEACTMAQMKREITNIQNGRV